MRCSLRIKRPPPSSNSGWTAAKVFLKPADLGLVLPSVVVPHQARNLLVNPLHPAMEQVAFVHQEPFQLDARLS